MAHLTEEQEKEYRAQKAEFEKQGKVVPEKKKRFYEITAKFKTKGYKPKQFICLVFWFDREGAIEIAKDRFDEFLETQTMDFTYSITGVIAKDYLFFETQPRKALESK